MEMVNKVTISDLLQNSDKAEFVEWVKDNIKDASKCVVVFGIKDGERLRFDGKQIGFSYDYELIGFCQGLPDLFVVDDAQEG